MRFTNPHLFKLSAIVVALLAMTLFVNNPGFNASASAADPLIVDCNTCGTCFPSCAGNDSRMMSLSGDGLESFVGGTLLVGFSTPAVPNPSITIGVFDPDSIGGPLPAVGKWDDFTANLTFKLFADPTGTGVPAPGPPLHEFTSADGFDSQWLDHLYDSTSLTFGSAPLTAIGGNYNFVLQITLDSGADALAINGFKVRTDRSLVLKGQTIQFIAKANRLVERQAIYPGWVSGQQCPTATQIANSTYDGTWEFSFNVPPGTTKLELWDGEFDFGSFDATTTDDNGVAQGDLNTPATGVCAETGGSPMECVDPDIPLWAQGTAADPEGPKGMGNPPDDIDPTFPGCQFLRAPSVTYKLIPPTGPVIFNNNPSGTGEWEKFLVSSVDLEPISDKKVPSPFIEQGLWTFRIEGMDVFNQFSLHFNLTVSPPCTTDIGDTVFEDIDGDGVQDPGDPGIEGVTLNLLAQTDCTGPYAFVGTAITDASGNYLFANQPPGCYRVDVTDTAGKLAGLTKTSGAGSQPDPYDLTTTSSPCADNLTADFGYRRIASGCAFLVIDEDSIDNGNPPNFFTAKNVNDDIAEIGVRSQLRYFAANPGKIITLHTGTVGDEGWFAVKTIPTSWNASGGIAGFIGNPAALVTSPPPHGVGPGLGAPMNGDREKLLDKIPNVTPLRATGLKNLIGKCICAVVYDSDISINYGPLNGSLKGANLGTVAFRVLSVTKLNGYSSSSLPKVQIEILDARQSCNGGATLLTDAEAPAPRSSSQPHDVNP